MCDLRQVKLARFINCKQLPANPACSDIAASSTLRGTIGTILSPVANKVFKRSRMEIHDIERASKSLKTPRRS